MFSSGGFGPSSQAFGAGTQGLSMGFGEKNLVGPGGDAASSKKRREEPPATVLPVTVRAIENALAQRADDGGSGELKVHGLEHGMLILVAAVEAVSKKETSMELMLNDSTGRIKARFYTHDQQPEEYDGVVPGRYVYMFGGVRTSPMVHFAVTGLRLVSSANEVSYHMIECAHAALKLRRPAAEPTTPMVKKAARAEGEELGGPAAMDVSPPKLAAAPPAEQAPAMTITGSAAPAAAPKARLEGAALRGAILDFIRNEGAQKQEGVTLVSVHGHAGPAPMKEVRNALEELVANGDIFTTLDDETFQIL